MEIKFTRYEHARDYSRIRNFLINIYGKNDFYHNWRLCRWDYSYFYIRHFLDVTQKLWDERTAIWENEEGDIVSIVNCEGCNRGETFFQIDPEYSEEIPYEEMFEFAEKNLPRFENGKKVLVLWIPSTKEDIKKIAKERGFYKVEDARDTTSEILLTKDFKIPPLPEGFRIQSMAERNDHVARTLAFAKAFGNYGTDGEVQPYTYKPLQEAPGYKKNLDVFIEAPDGEIASFCLIWYDEKNKFGDLEPVGTIPKYRKMGLGKAIVYEAMNRVRALGAEKVFVGDGQQFYLSIGFKHKYYYEIWKKEY